MNESDPEPSFSSNDCGVLCLMWAVVEVEVPIFVLTLTSDWISSLYMPLSPDPNPDSRESKMETMTSGTLESSVCLRSTLEVELWACESNFALKVVVVRCLPPCWWNTEVMDSSLSPAPLPSIVSLFSDSEDGCWDAWLVKILLGDWVVTEVFKWLSTRYPSVSASR